ncbi:MAG: hypothetical protein K0Q51_1472 [Rickettsiaceae bacterium]|jgi:hypothetical protein|nr:hypothetical protein [Rickettsiaceae bacterium]
MIDNSNQVQEKWYDYIDINNILLSKSNNQELYKVLEASSTEDLNLAQKVSEALSAIDSHPLKAVIIPINLGSPNLNNIYRGTHWVALVIKKNEQNILQAFYNDSLGNSMNESAPKLEQMLMNYGIEKQHITDFQNQQQNNGYDCGPWTVFNLDSLAKTSILPNDITYQKIIEQRENLNSLTDLEDNEILNISDNPSVENAIKDNPLKEPHEHKFCNIIKSDKEEYNMDNVIEGVKKITHSNIKFVASTIIYADGQESDESSDEEYNDSDQQLFDFELEDPKKFPYKPYTVKINKEPITVGYVKEPLNLILPNETILPHQSTVVQPLLDNLTKTGLERTTNEHIEDLVSISIALNRPLSLSTRKNNVLKKEVNAQVTSKIDNSRLGVFWEFKWVNIKGKKVSYDEVRTFYKKLKKYDAAKAKIFRESCEKDIAVPYQELRELIKNHENTLNLIKYARTNNPNVSLYLSIIDGDTKSFNGIYSAYMRIIDKSKILPTIMSTGYEFTEERAGDYPFVEGSRLDRLIRVATAANMQWSVYYPEPNFCILVPPNQSTVKASFIDKSIKLKNAESVALIRNLLKTEGAGEFTAVFINDNPLLTSIPYRVRFIKSKKYLIKFSEGFKSGLGPTEKDLLLFKQMSQSHCHESVWLDNLYINKGLILKGDHYSFKKLITRYIKSNYTISEEYTQADHNTLISLITKDDLVRIQKAHQARELVIKQYETKHLRTFEQEELIDFITNVLKLEVNDFTLKLLNIIITAESLPLIINGNLCLVELMDIEIDIVEVILYNDQTVGLIKDGNVTFNEIYGIYMDYIEGTDEDFYDIDLAQLVELLLNERESFENLLQAKVLINDIIKLYNENYEAFKVISDKKVISFLEKFGSEITFEDLYVKYVENIDLFNAMINDSENLIANIGVEDFIDKYEQKQQEFKKLLEVEGFSSDCDPYYSLVNEDIEDGCPDEILHQGSETDSLYYSDNSCNQFEDLDEDSDYENNLLGSYKNDNFG